MKYVVLYHPAPDVLTRAEAHYDAHVARIDEFHSRGDIEMVGVFGDPQTEGAMSVFPTREAAERFVDGDPFVSGGVIERVEIREWNELLTAG